MGTLVAGFMGLLTSSVLLIAGITGSSIPSVVKGHPDHSASDFGDATRAAGDAMTTPAKAAIGDKGNNAVAPGTQGHQHAAAIARQRGWSLPDWLTLIGLESGGNAQALNPTSGAFGIGQFLGSTKTAYASRGATSTSPLRQLDAMAAYIGDRYGTPTAALAFHRQHNYY